MGADCSQRVCPFGVSWADTPRGDLNSDGVVKGPGTNNAGNACAAGTASCDYTTVEKDQIWGQEGTTEAFPPFKTAEGLVVANAGHAYAECSSKGLCDRETGTCECFPGYEGSGCQYNTCPETDGQMCSGHGVCNSALEVSKGFYQMWDKDSTQGCVCDSGYEGFDCSMRKCKPGADPMAFTGGRNLVTDNSTYIIYQVDTGPLASGLSALAKVQGTYKLSISDAFGKMWETDDIDASSSCDTIITKIRAIPSDSFNGKVPIRCYRQTGTRGVLNEAGTDLTGKTGNGARTSSEYGEMDANTEIQEEEIETTSVNNPRMLVWEKIILSIGRYGTYKPMQVVMYDNKQRATLFGSHDAVSDVYAKTFSNGYASYATNIFPNACEDVYIRFDNSEVDTAAKGYVKLKFGVSGASDAVMQKRFEACLGDADGDFSNNIEKESFDEGTSENPHVFMAYELTQYNCYSYNPWPKAQWDSSTCDDENDSILPSNWVCDNHVYDPHLVTTMADRIPDGQCSNLNPSGIVAMTVRKAYGTPREWIIRNAIGADYTDERPFAVYTMDGIFQNVNSKAAAVATLDQNSLGPKAETFYSDYVHVMNAKDESGVVVPTGDFNGDLSCEDLPGRQPTNKQCLNNGDLVIFMSMPMVHVDPIAADSETGASGGTDMYKCNPRYTNIFTVDNVAKFPNQQDSIDHRPAVTTGWQQFFIKLTTGINFLGYAEDTTSFGTGVLPVCAMYIYKYIPNTTVTSSGGYLADQDCSGRGTCDSDNGVCQCFEGYSGDNCGTINSYAN